MIPATFTASEQLLAFARAWEGRAGKPCLTAYDDGGGVWTIAYGRTRGVKPGDTCTAEQAESWLREEYDQVARSFLPYFTRIPTQQQFDALLDLAYNAGEDAVGRAGVMQLFNVGDDLGCTDRLLLWNRDGGRVVDGLTRRRLAERRIYLAGDYSGRP